MGSLCLFLIAEEDALAERVSCHINMLPLKQSHFRAAELAITNLNVFHATDLLRRQVLSIEMIQ